METFDIAKQAYYLRRSVERKERRTVKRQRIAMLREAHRQWIANKGLIPALAVVRESCVKAQWRAMQAGF